MKKIPTLFQRNYDGDHLVRDEVTPGCEWVMAGEGEATIKLDGTCCMIRGGVLFKRYELRPGNDAPDGFVPAQEADRITGRIPGWVPVGDGPDDRWHREAFERHHGWLDGTYELCGPKVQGNPERFDGHYLSRHGSTHSEDPPRTFDGLREYLSRIDAEGIVWHHKDGRMVKIKGRDFGLKRGGK